MAKMCNKPGCYSPQFGGGFCQFHSYMRTDGKAPKPLKRAEINRSQKPLKRSPIKVRRRRTGERPLFDEILAKRPHRSFISGQRLNGFDIQGYKCCAHVLSKAKNRYPKFKLNPDNIVLLTFYEHLCYDHGSEAQRQGYVGEMAKQGVSVDWGKLYNLRDKLKAEYRELYG